MAITKTKEQIYEWFTTKNWFKLYERNLFNPSSIHGRVVASGCHNFKDYLDYAYNKFINEGRASFIEFLALDCNSGTPEGSTYWTHMDSLYWRDFMGN